MPRHAVGLSWKTRPSQLVLAAVRAVERAERRVSRHHEVARPSNRQKIARSRNGAHQAEDWIAIAVPPIMSEEIFALAQERLEAKKTHAPRRTVTPSVVQGLVSCAKCGYELYRTHARRRESYVSYSPRKAGSQ
jgi:site-specific DNA recombinase